MQAARRAWTEALADVDITKLVFIDETWISTNMTRGYGRAPKGQRCVASAPLSHWETTTFVAALRHQQLTAPMLTDGPMDGDIFLAYLHRFLCPTLTPGDLVIVDNLSSHKVAGVQRGHHRGRGHPALLTALFSGPESHRKALRQAQSPAPQSRHPHHRCALG